MKSKDKNRPVLYRGEVTISLSRASKGTSYKYLVVKKDEDYWEDLSEFSSNGGNVNRGLEIKGDSVKAGGK